MSSDESRTSSSSSRLSQFGLYRNIDAKTEEFLRLSRKRQMRQGCACAAVSTAITVTVVVTAILIYEYTVNVDPNLNQKTRKPTWHGLFNDTIPFEIKYNKAKINVDPTTMKLLAMILKVLSHDRDNEQTNKLEDSNTSPALARSETPDLTFSKKKIVSTAKMRTNPNIDFKSPVVVYRNPYKNLDYFRKIRETQEYQRMLKYFDRMISGKNDSPSPFSGEVDNATKKPVFSKSKMKKANFRLSSSTAKVNYMRHLSTPTNTESSIKPTNVKKSDVMSTTIAPNLTRNTEFPRAVPYNIKDNKKIDKKITKNEANVCKCKSMINKAEETTTNKPATNNCKCSKLIHKTLNKLVSNFHALLSEISLNHAECSEVKEISNTSSTISPTTTATTKVKSIFLDVSPSMYPFTPNDTLILPNQMSTQKNVYKPESKHKNGLPLLGDEKSNKYDKTDQLISTTTYKSVLEPTVISKAENRTFTKNSEIDDPYSWPRLLRKKSNTINRWPYNMPKDKTVKHDQKSDEDVVNPSISNVIFRTMPKSFYTIPPKTEITGPLLWSSDKETIKNIDDNDHTPSNLLDSLSRSVSKKGREPTDISNIIKEIKTKEANYQWRHNLPDNKLIIQTSTEANVWTESTTSEPAKLVKTSKRENKDINLESYDTSLSTTLPCMDKNKQTQFRKAGRLVDYNPDCNDVQLDEIQSPTKFKHPHWINMLPNINKRIMAHQKDTNFPKSDNATQRNEITSKPVSDVDSRLFKTVMENITDNFRAWRIELLNANSSKEATISNSVSTMNKVRTEKQNWRNDNSLNKISIKHNLNKNNQSDSTRNTLIDSNISEPQHENFTKLTEHSEHGENINRIVKNLSLPKLPISNKEQKIINVFTTSSENFDEIYNSTTFINKNMTTDNIGFNRTDDGTIHIEDQLTTLLSDYDEFDLFNNQETLDTKSTSTTSDKYATEIQKEEYTGSENYIKSMLPLSRPIYLEIDRNDWTHDGQEYDLV